ncbi:MAG: DUF1772 domain-containing protein [Chitinophagaceae bacterium]
MKPIILFASTILGSGILFANIYTSLIDAKSWGADIPRSIEVAREYFKTVNPGNFFRMFAPVNQFVALLALILFWKVSATVRIYLGIALALYVFADVFTFAYFYPRNSIMFEKGSLTDVETLKNAWAGWNTMNWLRSFMIFAGVVFSFMALHKIYFPK